MKRFFLLSFTALIFLSGCGTTRIVQENDFDDYDKINALASRKRARIITRDSKVFAASRLRIARDKTVWWDPKAGSERVIPTAHISRITFVNRVKGAVRGYRTAAGLFFSAILAANSDTDLFHFSASQAVAIALIGGLPGAGFGASMGYRENYILTKPADTLMSLSASMITPIQPRDTTRTTSRKTPISVATLQERTMKKDRARRWNLSAHLGGVLGGPARDLETGMTDTGLAGEGYCFFSCTDTPIYPVSKMGIGWSLVLEHHSKLQMPYFRVPITFAVSLSETSRSSTSGFSEESFSHLTIEHKTSLVSLSMLFRLTDALHVGVGPALYTQHVSNNRHELTDAVYHHKRVGLVLDAGLQFPLYRRVFFDIRTQYRLLGNGRVGPFMAWQPSSVERFDMNGPSVFPERRVNFNHWFFSAGTGIRF